MITPKFFQETCEKLFGTKNCTFAAYDQHVDTGLYLQYRLKCFAFGRIVASLAVFSDNGAILTVYPYNNKLPNKTTRFRFMVKRLLRWATYQETARIRILDGLAKQFNNQFYRHTDDIKYVIDRITDDVFVVNLREIASMLNDKADTIQQGHIFRYEIPVSDNKQPEVS